MTTEKEINWWPQERQFIAIQAAGLDLPFDGAVLRHAIADIIGYGGAAGGGKTHTPLQLFLLSFLFF